MCFAAGYATYRIKEINKLPEVSEIRAVENISKELSPFHQRIVRKTKGSAVRILSMSMDKTNISSFTGTYFTAKGRYYVVTVYHGLRGPCESTKIFTDEGFVDCIEYSVLSPFVDYAIFETEEIPELIPMRVPEDLPLNYNWIEQFSTLTSTYYTGFPNGHGPLTFPGKVVGYNKGDYAYVHSYAWSGSSGSGVFNAGTGKYIGYVMAIDVGSSQYGPNVMEDIIIVIPAFKIDWSQVLK